MPVSCVQITLILVNIRKATLSIRTYKRAGLQTMFFL